MGRVTLYAGEHEATFRPDGAMLLESLRYAGEQYVLPSAFLHPWANRRTEPGLAIHGNLDGVAFDVVRVERARLVACLEYGAHPEKLGAFPFPHVVSVDARLHATRGLALTTEIRPTGNVAVPISFGWHPYVRIPGVPRRSWVLRWPACEHLEVDAHVIPTGRRAPQLAERVAIGRRTFDDHYALGRDRTFSISAAGRTLTLRFDVSYRYAQLFVPPLRRFVAIEPMTAEIDALGRGTAAFVVPGARFRARFSICIVE